MSKIPIFTTPLTSPKKQQPRLSTPSKIPVWRKNVKETTKGSVNINDSPGSLHSCKSFGQTHLDWKTMKLNSHEPAIPVPLKHPNEIGVSSLPIQESLTPTAILSTYHPLKYKSETPTAADCPQTPNSKKRKVYSTGFDPRFPVLKRVRKRQPLEWDVARNNDKEPESTEKSAPTSEIATKPVTECTVLMQEALTRMYLLYQCEGLHPILC